AIADVLFGDENPSGKLPVTCIFMIIIEGDLPQRTRIGHRQFTGRIFVTEEDIGDRVARLNAEKPRFKDRRHMSRRPGDGQWPAIHENEHGRSTGLNYFPKELLLISRKIEICAACGFTA